MEIIIRITCEDKLDNALIENKDAFFKHTRKKLQDLYNKNGYILQNNHEFEIDKKDYPDIVEVMTDDLGIPDDNNGIGEDESLTLICYSSFKQNINLDFNKMSIVYYCVFQW